MARFSSSLSANIFASGLVVGLWGYFLIAAVYDPDGGIKALWPIFGIANQLLAATALCLATTIVLKMSLGAPNSGSARDAENPLAGSKTGAPLRSPALALVTLVPLLWLLAVTGTAAVQKIWHHEDRPGFPPIGFLQLAARAEQARPALQQALTAAQSTGSTTAIAAATSALRSNRSQVFNNRLDAFVTGFFLLLVTAIVLISVREWILLLARKKLAELRETPPTWLPDYAIAEGKPLHVFSVLTLGFALAKELSGEAALERAEQQPATVCAQLAPDGDHAPADIDSATPAARRQQLYVELTEKRFNGINRCC